MGSMWSMCHLARHSTRLPAHCPILAVRTYATRPPPPNLESFVDEGPAAWQRGAQATGFVLSSLATVYAVFFYDFGEQEHCFTPLRRQFTKVKTSFLTISEQDRRLLQAQGQTQSGSANDATAAQKQPQKRLV